jgi:hypothetical protein
MLVELQSEISHEQEDTRTRAVWNDLSVEKLLELRYIYFELDTLIIKSSSKKLKTTLK